MKRVRINLFFVAVLGLSILCGSAWATEGPIAHWKLDETSGTTAYDSADGYDGSVHGADWTAGIIGGALDFDGKDDYVNFGDVDEFEFGNNDFTISAWIYAEGEHGQYIPLGYGTPGWGAIISKYNWGIQGSSGRQWYLNQGPAGQICFYTNPTGIYSHEYLTSVTDGYQYQWVHVAAVRNGSTKLLYINGVLDTTGATAGVVTGKSSKVLIGTHEVYDKGVWTKYGHFNGIIDDVRIYDRALSAQEVEQLYEEGMLVVAVDIKPGRCPNPLNVRSRGVLPVVILGAEYFDVNEIDVASIRLAGVAPIRSSYEDVATPVSDGNECDCTTEGPDGYTDLTLKFRTQEIVEELVNAQGELADGEVLVLTLMGVLSDQTPIEGADCIVLVGNVPKALAAKRWDYNGDGIINILDFAELATYWLESTVY